MDDVADVLIVGAGPAGATAALAALRAQPGAKVRLLDAATFPRDKACGDGIAPQALAELQALGVHDLTADHEPVRWLDLRTPGGVRLRAEPPRPNYVIPRKVFDARLVAAAVAAGVELVQHRARRIEVRDDLVIVDGEQAGRVLIAADGANSVSRRAIGLPRNPDDHLAVAVRGYAVEHVDDWQPAAALGSGGTANGNRDRAQLIDMQNQDWPAYVWSFPLADGSGRANIGYGRLRSALSTRSQLWGELQRLLPDQPAEDLRAHHLPLSTWRPPQPDGRVLLVGDAASLINPLTGEGIFYAVRSGRLAGTAAVNPGGSVAGAAYRRSLARSLGRHLRHTSALALLSRHRPALDAALAAAATRPALLDRLVEVGLGDGLIPPALLPLTVGTYLHRLGRRLPSVR
ncbi:MAG TPA: geranylgeranyl reductase family protein [Kineosporiaceae bacterium]|nr:geranylgeranyl reductase family protein [Kineosporiaceae bacterium]